MGATPRTLTAISAALIVMLSVATYQPWLDSGFDIEDFSEFQPILAGSAGFVQRTADLTDYYESQGRWNVAVYAALAAKWSLLGPEPTSWQWLRLVQLCVIVGMTAMLLLRVTGVRSAAALAAPFMLFGPSAASAFSRLTLSEPLALLLLLPALVLGAGYQLSSRWLVRAFAIALLLGLVVLTKEVLVVTVPLALAFTLCWTRDTGWRLPRWSPRDVILLAATIVVVGAACTKILIVHLEAPSEAYSASYGARVPSPVEALSLWLMMIYPVSSVVPGQVAVLFLPGYLLLACLVVAGTLLWVRRVVPLGQGTTWLGICFAITIAGTVAYLPWPRFEAFYALPFALGVLLPVAGVAAAASRVSPAGTRLASGVVALAGVFIVAAAHANVAAHRAHRAMMGEVAELIADTPTTGSVVVRTRRGSASWQAEAATLERTAMHVKGGAGVPPVTAAACDGAVPSLLPVTTVVVVSFVDECGVDPLAHRSITKPYRFWSWQSPSGLQRLAYTANVRSGS